MQGDKLVEIQTQFNSTYQLSFNSKIKPQEYVKNNLKGEKIIKDQIEKTIDHI